jgi:hypothetical protein
MDELTALVSELLGENGMNGEELPKMNTYSTIFFDVA